MERISALERSAVLGKAVDEILGSSENNAGYPSWHDVLHGKATRIRAQRITFPANGRIALLENSFVPVYGKTAEQRGGMAVAREHAELPKEPVRPQIEMPREAPRPSPTAAKAFFNWAGTTLTHSDFQSPDSVLVGAKSSYWDESTDWLSYN